MPKYQAFAPLRNAIAKAVWVPLFVASSVFGCVEINGGAVEVSWAIFSRDGRAIRDCSCAEPSIGFVRLQLVSEADPTIQPCAGVAACRFSCGRQTGATPFMVPPGQYLMSVIPVAPDGTDLPTTSAPGGEKTAVQTLPPVSRTVVRGQPTGPEAFGLETECAARCNGGAIFSACTD